MRPTHHIDTLPWNHIHTLLLDMDGTLLDLHYDNYFWRDYMPARYAASRGLDIPTASRLLAPLFKRHEGTLNWYCIDFWTRELQLDIEALKRDVKQFIAIKSGALAFLTRLRQAGKRTVLVTNAHPKSLALKLEHTRLDDYLDQIISAHTLGLPKEHPAFWKTLQQSCAFDPAHTLLIDDNLNALRSAQQYGLAYLLAVRKPSSLDSTVIQSEFAMLEEFDALLPLRGDETML